MMNGDQARGLILAWGLILSLGLILLVVWQGFETWRARAFVAREEAYRKVAEQSAAAQQRTAEEQQKISEDLGDLRARVAAIEKLLRDVG